MCNNKIQRTGILVLLCVVVLLSASSLWGQGCAMCYTSVANSDQVNQAKGTLNRAILMLLVPPVTMFIGIFVLAYRLRDKFRGEAASFELSSSPLNKACPASSQAQKPHEVKRTLAA